MLPDDRFLLDLTAAAGEVPAHRFMDWAFEALEPVLRFDSACWGIGTHFPPVSHVVHLRHQPVALLDAYEGGMVEHDFLRRAAAAAPGRTINNRDLAEAHRSEKELLFEQICIPFGIQHVLATSLPDRASGLDHLLLLWRGGFDDPFTEDERARMERIVPHLVLAHATARRIHLLAQAARPSQRGHALADPKGVLLSFDSRFVKLIRRQWPEWAGPVLPGEIPGQLRAGELSAGPLRFAIRARGALFDLTLECDPARTLPPAERRVATRFADGETHRAIATALGLAPATVRNQVQRAYRRLGVSSRTELARRLAGDE